MLLLVITTAAILGYYPVFTDTIANKLHMQKVSDFKLSPGDQPCKVNTSQNIPSTHRKPVKIWLCFCGLQVAVYVPGTKGAPSFVRLYQYPALAGPGAALANKSFFKADKVNMQWNKKGADTPPLSPPVFPESRCNAGSRPWRLCLLLQERRFW